MEVTLGTLFLPFRDDDDAGVLEGGLIVIIDDELPYELELELELEVEPDIVGGGGGGGGCCCFRLEIGMEDDMMFLGSDRRNEYSD